jgi:mRNA interferase RelE/StbE
VRIRQTKSFFSDYQGLPASIRSRVDKHLTVLLDNPRHLSLRLKKLRSTDKFEIRITRGYRLTFRYSDQTLELRRVGTHDLLKREG